MRRLLMVVGVLVAGLWSVGSLAATTIGVVDMQKIFQDSPQVKKIQDSLNSEFSGKRDQLREMGKTLEADIRSYQKNKSVMSASKLASLKNKINQEEMKLRDVQGKLQQEWLTEQNKKMNAFIDEVKLAAKTVADKRGMDVVLTTNSVLYSKDDIDITSDVLSDIK